MTLVCTPCRRTFAARKPEQDYCSICGEPRCDECAAPHRRACSEAAEPPRTSAAELADFDVALAEHQADEPIPYALTDRGRLALFDYEAQRDAEADARQDSRAGR